jgi:7-carboxy-7-deazaguanine synthase
MAGAATYFIRVAGCGYRCSWCDSPHAVLPELWAKSAPRLSAHQMLDELEALARGPRWVTLSGGNPAMYDLSALVEQLHFAGYRVCVETQGDTWQDWLIWVDQLVLSPKPPSSGEATIANTAKWEAFCERCVRGASQGYATALKLVIFDEADYEWAVTFLAQQNPQRWPAYFSVGTPEPNDAHPTDWYRDEVCRRYADLADRVAHDERLSDVRVIPQLHVLAHGERRGT